MLQNIIDYFARNRESVVKKTLISAGGIIVATLIAELANKPLYESYLEDEEDYDKDVVEGVIFEGELVEEDEDGVEDGDRSE